MLFKKNKPKIFCIGQNKTGTTSLKKFFQDHGFRVGDQPTAEQLIDDYIARNWKPILKYCETAEVFQDVPFSNDYLYVVLDFYFPNAKFILSERDNAEQWYNSITKFHAKLFGRNGNLPDKNDLQNANYRVKEFIWKNFNEKFGEIEGDIYNKENLTGLYTKRNEQIKHYFKDKSNFLAVNLSQPDAVQKMADFLQIKPKYQVMPWENKTEAIKK
jgi:hypothetical protein